MRLSAAAQECYKNLRDAVSSGEWDVKVPPMNDAEIGSALDAVTLDHPEFYFLAREYLISKRGADVLVKLQPLYSESLRAEIDATLFAAVSEVRRSLTGGFEDAEKKVAEYLVRRTNYEQNADRNQNAAAALYFHRAQCSGIARAVKYLMDRLGKWCIVVTGKARNEKGKEEPHAWNIVSGDGNFYHLDVTYLLGANPDAKNGAPLRYAFFNYSDEAMKKTHKWETSKAPVCTDKRYDNALYGVGYEEIPEIETGALCQYMEQCGGRKFRFRLKGKGDAKVLQEKIALALREYCRKSGTGGMARMACLDGVWEVEIN